MAGGVRGYVEQFVGAVRGRHRAFVAAPRPQRGWLTRPREWDAWTARPADGLTPLRLASILRAADEGDLSEQMALFEQMEEKDPHLHSVATTRRLAVTGLGWRIASAGEVDPDGTFDRGLADEAADYCRAAVARLERFDETLSHLALAIGRNVAAAELIWELGRAGPRLAAIEPVPFGRLRIGRLGELRIVTRPDADEGEPPRPWKFVVHRVNAASGHAGRGGLLRASALAYLGKQFAIKDWLVFAEVFGMPLRIARYEPSATPEEKRELLEMLTRLGSDAAGVFSKAVELEIRQTRVPGDVNPYETMCHFFNRELSKAWLGQTLTTDTARALANLGAAEVHDQVRRDLRDDDLRQEARTIRRDLLAVLTRVRCGERAEPPYFRRLPERPRDVAAFARTLSVAVNELGARVPADWAQSVLGIPPARAGEATLPGVRTTVGGERRAARFEGGGAE